MADIQVERGFGVFEMLTEGEGFGLLFLRDFRDSEEEAEEFARGRQEELDECKKMLAASPNVTLRITRVVVMPITVMGDGVL